MKPLIIAIFRILSPFNSGLEAQVKSYEFNEVYLAQENLNEKARKYLNEAKIAFKNGLNIKSSNFSEAKNYKKHYVIEEINYQLIVIEQELRIY